MDDKIYCSNCKYYYPPHPIGIEAFCDAPENKMDSYSCAKAIRLKEPKRLNDRNDCWMFEPSLWFKLKRLFSKK